MPLFCSEHLLPKTSAHLLRPLLLGITATWSRPDFITAAAFGRGWKDQFIWHLHSAQARHAAHDSAKHSAAWQRCRSWRAPKEVNCSVSKPGLGLNEWTYFPCCRALVCFGTAQPCYNTMSQLLWIAIWFSCKYLYKIYGFFSDFQEVCFSPQSDCFRQEVLSSLIFLQKKKFMLIQETRVTVHQRHNIQQLWQNLAAAK